MSEFKYRQLSVAGILDGSVDATAVWTSLAARMRRINLGWWLIVVIPAILAGLYLFFIASDIYMSESRFIVRSEDQGSPTPSLSSILPGIGQGPDYTSSVESYLTSRNAVNDLERSGRLRTALGRPGGDFLTRFPNILFGSSFEGLFRRYQYSIDITVDSSTDIATLQVYAFRPEDAQAINRALLHYSDRLVNDLNARALGDEVQQAQHQVDEVEKKLANIRAQMTFYRLNQKILDPTLASTSIYNALTGVLTDRATTAAQLGELESKSPNSPSIPGLRARLAALDGQLDRVMNGGISGNSDALARKLADYQRLSLEDDTESKELASAADALQMARIDALRKHLYIEHIADPNWPDYPLYPRRFLYFAFFVVCCLLIYGIGWMLVAGIREHTAA